MAMGTVGGTNLAPSIPPPGEKEKGGFLLSWKPEYPKSLSQNQRRFVWSLGMFVFLSYIALSSRMAHTDIAYIIDLMDNGMS